MQFLTSGVVDVEVVVKGNGNSYMEANLAMVHEREELYGRGVKRVEAFDREVFVNLSGDRYEPGRCVVPIVIEDGGTANSYMSRNITTNNTVNNTTTNSTTTADTTNNKTNDTTSSITTNIANNTIPQPLPSDNNTNPTDYTYDTTTGFEVNQLIFLLF